ncbi:hypothetical protein N7504_000872 [Penicillium tannophilum]|nr:hypothetical protein N7504_000872 [Penicillium tannophilum]
MELEQIPRLIDKIFETQTMTLRCRLGDDFDFDFVGGDHPWPAAPGIAEVFGSDEICYSYFDGSALGAISTVEDLASYVVENGPFHGVMGFSLGAALAVTLLLNSTKVGFVEPPFKFAILLCSVLPCDWDALQSGEVKFLDPTQVTHINIPTIHFWSPKDVVFSSESRLVVEMCDAASRVNLQHQAGHNMPAQPSGIEELAQAILEVSRIHGRGELEG